MVMNKYDYDLYMCREFECEFTGVTIEESRILDKRNLFRYSICSAKQALVNFNSIEWDEGGLVRG